MAKSKSSENTIKLKCSGCSRFNYYTRKNRKTLAEVKLSLKKYCKWCRKHTLHKESKR